MAELEDQIEKELEAKRAKSKIWTWLGVAVFAVGLAIQLLPYLIPVNEQLTKQWYVPLIVMGFGVVVMIKPLSIANSAISLLTWYKEKK